MSKYGVALEMCNLKDTKGFTIVEVTIALAVLAIGILSLYTMQTRAIYGNAVANTFSNLTISNLDQIEQLYAASYDSADLAAGNHSVTQNGMTVSWNVVDDNPIDGCKLVTVTVSGIFGGTTKEMETVFIKSEIQK